MVEKRGMAEADQGADGWEVISDREESGAQAVLRVAGIAANAE